MLYDLSVFSYHITSAIVIYRAEGNTSYQLDGKIYTYIRIAYQYIIRYINIIFDQRKCT